MFKLLCNLDSVRTLPPPGCWCGGPGPSVGEGQTGGGGVGALWSGTLKPEITFPLKYFLPILLRERPLLQVDSDAISHLTNWTFNEQKKESFLLLFPFLFFDRKIHFLSNHARWIDGKNLLFINVAKVFFYFFTFIFLLWYTLTVFFSFSSKSS